MDLFTFVTILIAGSPILLFPQSVVAWAGALVLALLFGLVIGEPFQRCERNARAVRRQRQHMYRDDGGETDGSG
jgi:hypothetical protein